MPQNEETSKFVSELRDICVTIGMEFAILEPSVMFHLDNPDSVAVYRIFSMLHGLVESEAMKMQTGLLIVILPDSRCYDAEVERRCKKLGVTYQNCLPQNVRTSTNKYLNSVACEINTKVLFRNVFCNALLNKQQCFQSTEQMGDDCVSENFSDKMGKDHGSIELCSQHLELKDGDTSEHCDEDMGEYDESCGVLDEEMWDSGNCNDDGNYDDSEDGDSDLIEDESYLYETEDSEESDSDEDMREDARLEGIENYITPGHFQPPFTAFLCPDSDECVHLLKAGWGTTMAYKKPSTVSWDDYSKLFDTNGYYKLIKGKLEDKSLVSPAEGASVELVDKNSNTAAGHVVNDNFIGRTGMAMPIERRLSEKQPWLMGVKSTKRDYSAYGNMKIHRGVVVDWACVNFSHLGDRQLHRFSSKLSYVCDSIRMCFNSSPLETYHEKSADPDNIANTFSNVLEDLSRQFAALDMEGETIGLVLVILPEARDIDAKIEDVCKEYGVLYHCLLPSVISMGEDESLKKLAYEIKSKVVERDTFIPFVSEGPTLIFGAAASCNVASVVAPLKWQKFRNYKAVFGPNNGAIIDLFSNEEDGGTISNLLFPFCKKIERGCRIIFFRHCDTEDHICNIWQHEVHAIKLGCNQLRIGCKPSVTFVVVGGNKDESSNIGKADFVCHHGFVKGTTPNRYRVVLDDNNLTVEQLESIIIKLCLLPTGLRCLVHNGELSWDD